MLSSIFALSDVDYENIHEIKGADTVSKAVLQSAIASRERNDGSGPMGLTNEQIPLYARIIAIAEIFYALTTNNEFYERMSVFDALKICRQNI